MKYFIYPPIWNITKKSQTIKRKILTTDGAKHEISREKKETEKGAKNHGHKSDPIREEDETQRGEKSRSQRGAKRTLLYHDGIGEADHQSPHLELSAGICWTWSQVKRVILLGAKYWLLLDLESS
jgi:hypothetical protein